ncbi:MAG: RNA methyltransferase [Rhizobiaceae bacterium]|nr:RNA methyltransferase [Rhizobiaceae bacterium]
MRSLIRISDPDDTRIAAFRDIRERDLVGRRGLFIAEGKVVLDVLRRSDRFEIVSILLLENRVAGLEDLLASLPAAIPVHVADRAVIDAIAGFPMHRGILALGRRRQAGDAGTLLASLPSRALVLALVGIANHDNVGAMFRNAAAFGADAVLLDAGCCDPLYRKAIRVSVGGVFRVPYAVLPDAGTMLRTVLDHAFDPVALSPRGQESIAEARRSERTALFLGTEGEGLPPTLMQAMRTVRIAMAPGFDSLNVSAASAIALHRFGG